MTPIGSASNITAVATDEFDPEGYQIFECMEDEYMIAKSVKQDINTAGADSNSVDVTDSLYEATNGVNGGNCIINFDRQALMEAFEPGGVYYATFDEVSGSTGGLSDDASTHLMCIAVGQDIDLTTPLDTSVQFVTVHSGTATTIDNNGSTVASDAVWYVEQHNDGADLIAIDTDCLIELAYVGNAGAFHDAGTKTSFTGASISPTGGTSGFGVHLLLDADYFKKEGGIESRRRKKNSSSWLSLCFIYSDDDSIKRRNSNLFSCI